MEEQRSDRKSHTKWLLCPKCGQKTRIKLRADTLLKNFPLFCPKCKQESLINVQEFKIYEVEETK
ncbi:MAG: cysteine-rich KTR domain-containing protein [bacterium]|nr:cysteine-rich KTR domain-containing protein [bacterium]